MCSLIGGMAAIRIGTAIRRARERKRWSQKDMADRLGVSRSAVNAWENGRAYPQNSIGALEELLGISLTEDTIDDPALAAEDEWERLVLADPALRTREKRDIILRARRLRAELYPAPSRPAAPPQHGGHEAAAG